MATIEHQPTNLRHVTRPHPEAAPILWVAVREPCPRDIGDIQGIEQQCGGKHIEPFARRPANGLRGEPARGLARDMGRMVVENDLDGGVGGVDGVEELEKLDELRDCGGVP